MIGNFMLSLGTLAIGSLFASSIAPAIEPSFVMATLSLITVLAAGGVVAVVEVVTGAAFGTAADLIDVPKMFTGPAPVMNE